MAGRKTPKEDRPITDLQIRKQRHDGFSPEQQDIFFATLAMTANVTTAAGLAGIGIASVYRHKKSDAHFARRWRQALTDGHAELTRRMLERALRAEGHVDGAIAGSDPDLHALAVFKAFPDRVAEILFRAHAAACREAEDDAEIDNDEDALAKIEARLNALRAARGTSRRRAG